MRNKRMLYRFLHKLFWAQSELVQLGIQPPEVEQGSSHL